MGLMDKFLDMIKLNDDFDEEDDFLDDDFDEEDDFEEEKPKRRFFKKAEKAEEDEFDSKPPVKEKKEAKAFKQPAAASSTYKKPSSKVTPMRKKSASMEVNVIRPASMEDARDIADTLMNSCTVILNLEGLDVDIAQRIIDFTCGACYSLGGSLQKIAGYIYILTPADVDISGDFQEILNGAFDVTTMR